MNNSQEYLKNDKENELIQKHELFVQKNNSSNFYICPQNKDIGAFIKDFINNNSPLNNSLYIWGNKGIGKTHLVGSLVSTKSNYLYIDVFDFINKYYEYQKLEKDFSKFINWLSSFELIIFDSLDLIKDKPNIKQLLINLTNKQTKQKFIFIGIKEELSNKFPTSIQLQDPDTYDLQIITSQFLSSYNKNIKLTKAAFNYLISVLENNIHIIISKLTNWLVIYGDPNSFTPIGIDDLNKTLKINIHNHQLIKEICTKLNIGVEDLISQTRKQKIVLKRDIAIYILKKKLFLTHETIGRLLNKNHSTISHSIKKIEEKKKDPLFKRYLETFFQSYQQK